MMGKLLKLLMIDRRGATAIEYGLIAAFISVALVAALPSIRSNILALFSQVDSSLEKGQKYAR